MEGDGKEEIKRKVHNARGLLVSLKMKNLPHTLEIIRLLGKKWDLGLVRVFFFLSFLRHHAKAGRMKQEKGDKGACRIH